MHRIYHTVVISYINKTSFLLAPNCSFTEFLLVFLSFFISFIFILVSSAMHTFCSLSIAFSSSVTLFSFTLFSTFSLIIQVLAFYQPNWIGLDCAAFVNNMPHQASLQFPNKVSNKILRIQYDKKELFGRHEATQQCYASQINRTRKSSKIFTIGFNDELNIKFCHKCNARKRKKNNANISPDTLKAIGNGRPSAYLYMKQTFKLIHR